MKNFLLTISLAALCLSASAQTVPLLTGNPIKYEEIVKTDSSLSKNELYALGQYWFANTYKNGKAVLQTEDKENGVLIGRAVFSIYVGGTSLFYPGVSKQIAYMVKLQFKDGKFRYELYNFNEDAYGGYQLTDGEPTYSNVGSKIAKKYYEETKEKVDLSVKNLILLMKNAFIKEGVTASVKNNW